ncbi:unnamed protein product [Miscanthus lutarioriparius]|uniref:Uncharacterized protein n=1 Tax=Miscanthus lutarioriparius TaxID=422564 RepID=A0A811QDW4_9POAL|nr:unnamed protein product [Miscanthus lutarioriparius]
MEIVNGALPTVLSKLGELLVNEYSLQKGLKGEIMFLEAELKSMQGALEKVSSTLPDQVDNQDKIWANEVRELSYDIEDSIDTFMVHDKSSELARLHGFKKFIERSLDLLTGFRLRHNFATEFRGLKRRAIEVAERRVRLRIDDDVAKRVTIDTRISARYKKVTELVGIDEERDTVIKILMEDNKVPRQQENVVSIFGFGGLGKTTLANVVYEKLRTQFDCSAFVSVSQTPDLNKIFEDMFHQLARQSNGSIDSIREFLLEKRYFIIIDDIWDISVWKNIRCAFPKNNCGCRIITTTRISDVAQQVGGAYNMKPLSVHNSRKLFFRRIFGSENKWNMNNEDTRKLPDEELVEVSDRILKKCAGVPLAIITIASLLASKGRNKIEWYEVCNSIGTGLVDGQDVDNMRKILSFSYYGMPSHLRTCLLYLSVFPEDYKINKDRLIRMWIAEGFIKCRKEGDSLLELGESYFNELINRSVIQPVCELYNGLVDHCRVHDMMLDLICSISSEENFVTILNEVHHTSPSKSDRRLSIQSAKVDHASLGASMSIVQVRSVVVFPVNVNVIPALEGFRFLRVLDLQYYEISQECSLSFLGYLHLLRHLGLRFFTIKPLPKEIGNLRFLQALDVKGTARVLDASVSSILPLTVLQLRHLRSLHITEEYVLNGIGSLTSLEELTVYVSRRSSENIMEELGHLTELRVLFITFYNIRDEKWEDSLVGFLCKLRKLRSLNIWWNNYDLNLDGWVTPRRLCRLETRMNQVCWGLSKLPAWMEDSSLLVDLSVISIRLKDLQREDLEILGRLPALRILHLEMNHRGRRIIGGFAFGAGSFPSLVHYKLQNIGAVVFQNGAMRRLQMLEFTCPVRETRELAGGFDLGNLLSLQHVHVYVEAQGASKEENEIDRITRFALPMRMADDSPRFEADESCTANDEISDDENLALP